MLVERHLQQMNAGLLGDFLGTTCRSVDYCVEAETRLTDSQNLFPVLEKGDLWLFAALSTQSLP